MSYRRTADVRFYKLTRDGIGDFFSDTQEICLIDRQTDGMTYRQTGDMIFYYILLDVMRYRQTVYGMSYNKSEAESLIHSNL